MKQRQQKELAESIIGKITKELENPRTLQQILQQSVADIESELKSELDSSSYLIIDTIYRDRVIQSPIDLNLIKRPLPFFSRLQVVV